MQTSNILTYYNIMAEFLIFLIVIAALLLIVLVLVQNSKGGGLAAGFGSGNQVMGVRKTTDFLEKSTWSLIACIILFSIGATIASKIDGKSVDTNTSAISEQVQEAAQQAAPVQGFGEEAE